MSELKFDDPKDLLESLISLSPSGVNDFEEKCNDLYGVFGWSYYYPTAAWEHGSGWIVTCRLSLDPKGLHVRGGIGHGVELGEAQDMSLADAAKAYGITLRYEWMPTLPATQESIDQPIVEVSQKDADDELEALAASLRAVLVGRVPTCDHSEKMFVLVGRIKKKESKKFGQPYVMWRCSQGGRMPCQSWVDDSDVKKATKLAAGSS